MKRLTEDIINFFNNQNFVIVSTFDKGKAIHSSCKGIVRINRNGNIYLLDLYKSKTYENLKKNSKISITAVNEHKFISFCLKGKAKIIKKIN